MAYPTLAEIAEAKADIYGVNNTYSYPHQIGESYYREKADDSPNYSFSADRNKCTRHFFTRWEDDPDAIPRMRRDFLGFSTVSTWGGNLYFARQNPHKHPNFPDLYAFSVDNINGVVPAFRDNNGVGTYDEALIAVSYNNPMISNFPYWIMSDAALVDFGGLDFPDESSLLRNCAVIFEPAGKYQTLPPFASLKWDWPDLYEANRLPLTNIVSHILVEADLTIHWVDIPQHAIPWAAINNCVGKTNENPLGHPLAMCGEFEAGTLVYLFPKIKYRYMGNGELAATISYKMKYYPYGANYYYWWKPPAGLVDLDGSPLLPGYYQASMDGDENPQKRNFKPGDFAALFQPEV